MATDIDAFTSPTLKHLRESWWDDEFTEFLRETLKPRPGNRILDVGCGEGLGEVAIGRLHISQVKLFGVDLVVSKVIEARRETAAHNQRVGFAAADASHLPFADESFDSLYCVAVLQHIGDVRSAIREFARVVARNGRLVVVEPDNAARYVYSSAPSGRQAFDEALRFFALVGAVHGEKTEPTIGPKIPALFAESGIEPVAVRLFPVPHTSLGPIRSEVWAARRAAIETIMTEVRSDEVLWTGRKALSTLGAYESEARQSGTAFVEIQNTLLFATLGQKV